MKWIVAAGLFLGTGLPFFLFAAAHGQEKKKGLDMRVPFTRLDHELLFEGKEPGDIPGIYIYPAKKPNGAAIVVCPGGGYGGHAMDHEGIQIADWLNANGITAAVLKYRLGPKHHYPAQLQDAQCAIQHVRVHAEKLKIDPKRVGILGFSAGGHLASTVATAQVSMLPAASRGSSRAEDQNAAVAGSAGGRPDFAVLLYPVITLDGPYAHVGSRNNLLGKNPDSKLVELLSTHKQVTKDTPPTFLAHTSEDRAVPPENSVMFYQALHKHGVPAELHIYQNGQHGLGLGRKDMPFASWPDCCIAWMNARGLLESKK